MNGLTSNNTKIRKKLEWYDIRCPYRSMSGTGTSVLGVILLVWVQAMDRYEHSGGRTIRYWSAVTHCTMISNTSGAMVSSMVRYSLDNPVWQCWKR